VNNEDGERYNCTQNVVYGTELIIQTVYRMCQFYA